MIGDHGNEFAERNVFLQLALGLLSASRKVDHVLEKYGRANSMLPVVTSAQDEQLLEFVLGVIAFRNSIVQTLEQACPIEPMPPTRAFVLDEPLQEPLR